MNTETIKLTRAATVRKAAWGSVAATCHPAFDVVVHPEIWIKLRILLRIGMRDLECFAFFDWIGD